MSTPLKNKDLSPLVQSVLSLDANFSSLERLSAQIDELELKNEFDFKQMRLFMNKFAECGDAVSTEIVQLAQLLGESRARAESAGKLVSAKAELLQSRQTEEDKQTAAFLALAGKVQKLNQDLQDFKKPEGETMSDNDRAILTHRFAEVEQHIEPLIKEARQIKKEAQLAKMKVLEQNADALSQSLVAVKQKLSGFTQPITLPQ